ncbi:MAG: hypothetical protein ABWY36_04340 [Leifsonia sp.]
MRSLHSGVAIPADSGVTTALPIEDTAIVGEFGERFARVGRVERMLVGFVPVLLCVGGLAFFLTR